MKAEYAPDLNSNEEKLYKKLFKLLKMLVINRVKMFFLGMDVASSEFYDKTTKKYVLASENNKSLSSEELVSYYKNIVNKYPIISIEDGLDENDWEGWKLLTKKIRS